MSIEELLPIVEEMEVADKKPPGVIKVAVRMWRTRVGLLIVALLCVLALFGGTALRRERGCRSAVQDVGQDPQTRGVRLGQRWS